MLSFGDFPCEGGRGDLFPVFPDGRCWVFTRSCWWSCGFFRSRWGRGSPGPTEKTYSARISRAVGGERVEPVSHWHAIGFGRLSQIALGSGLWHCDSSSTACTTLASPSASGTAKCVSYRSGLPRVWLTS